MTTRSVPAVRRGSLRSCSPAVAASALLALAGAASPACAIVTGDEMSAPSEGYVGTFNGSSGVAIGAHWFISAKHVGGSVNSMFTMKGVTYRAVQIVQHPTMDIMLVRVAETLPGYHTIAEDADVQSGSPCVLGGWGVTAGDALSDGWNWNGPHKETWGANLIDSAGSIISIQFDGPSSGIAVPHEATFAVNDSGGGLFVYGPEGDLRLAGIAVSVTGWGSSRYGNAAFAISLPQLYNWIMPYVDPSRPLASSVEAPRASLGHPVTTLLFLGTAGSALLGRAGRRRR